MEKNPAPRGDEDRRKIPAFSELLIYFSIASLFDQKDWTDDLREEGLQADRWDSHK